jgi:hypothetical protein
VMGRIPKRFFVDDWEPKEFWHKALHVRTEAQRQGLDAFH